MRTNCRDYKFQFEYGRSASELIHAVNIMIIIMRRVTPFLYILPLHVSGGDAAGEAVQHGNERGGSMDPLSFPVLTGTVLQEAVKFLFDRAAAALDRRAGRAPLAPERQTGHAEPLQPRLAELTETRIERIMQAQGALGVYLARPELLQGDDERLRELLSHLRADLEAIYGQKFAFGSEKQPPRPGVEVRQRADSVINRQVGVRAHGVSETARVQVIQTARTIEATGEQVGVEIEGPIG
ncbi:hypothetical protein ACGF0D_34675 [Kitasatospora sp. NPDC048298]|uniref:hypothetical protein n=1 Tax=Kitasatospora sp. NPDC048298 TaxID=3364049 RepID=UPI00372332AE